MIASRQVQETQKYQKEAKRGWKANGVIQKNFARNSNLVAQPRPLFKFKDRVWTRDHKANIVGKSEHIEKWVCIQIKKNLVIQLYDTD